jgi:hypothetical protein
VADHPGLDRLQGVEAGHPEVVRVPHRHRPHGVVAGQLDGQLHGRPGSHEPQPVVGVEDGGRPPAPDHLQLRFGVELAPGDAPQVAGGEVGAVTLDAGQVGQDEDLGDARRLGRRYAGVGEEIGQSGLELPVVDDADRRFGAGPGGGRGHRIIRSPRDRRR